MEAVLVADDEAVADDDESDIILGHGGCEICNELLKQIIPVILAIFLLVVCLVHRSLNTYHMR